jgi:hypothetical protein
MLLGFFITKANDSTYEKKLMERIYTAQSTGTGYFAKGLFPSYREYYFNRGTYKNDDNIFFTALVAFTLQHLKPGLRTDSKILLDSIISKASPVYKKFQNRRGLPIYSFWMTSPKKYFPNTHWLSFFKTNALPDDLDCSAVVLQATNAPYADVNEMHRYIQNFTNKKSKKVVSTFKAYKKLPAYSTWLSHKVPIDFDICALANLLVLVHKYKLDYTAADSASLQLISESIRNRHYQTHSEIISPYYNKTAVILYHISRLMSSKFIPELEQFKSQLIADAEISYRLADNFLDKIILSTSLLRWGIVSPMKDLESELKLYCQVPDKQFVFFVANMAAMLPNPLTRFMIRSNIGRFDYYCPAYNDVLVLENLVLRKALQLRLY